MSFYALSLDFRCNQVSSPVITQDYLLWLVPGATANICRDVLARSQRKLRCLCIHLFSYNLRTIELIFIKFDMRECHQYLLIKYYSILLVIEQQLRTLQ
jgi:hypothetical protein